MQSSVQVASVTPITASPPNGKPLPGPTYFGDALTKLLATIAPCRHHRFRRDVGGGYSFSVKDIVRLSAHKRDLAATADMPWRHNSGIRARSNASPGGGGD